MRRVRMDRELQVLEGTEVVEVRHLKLLMVVVAACRHRTTGTGKEEEVTVPSKTISILVIKIRVKTLTIQEDKVEVKANKLPDIVVKATWNINHRLGTKTSTANRTAKITTRIQEANLCKQLNILIRIRRRLINKPMQRPLRLRCITKIKQITTITIQIKTTENKSCL